MQINLIKPGNEKEIIVHDTDDRPINFFPDRKVPNNIIIHIGDKSGDQSKEQQLTYNKREIEIIFTREDERKQLRNYLKVRERESIEMRGYLKACEVFYHNFIFDVKMKEEIVKSESKVEDEVKEKVVSEKVKELPKRMVKNYD